MRISKTVINFLLVVTACLTILSVTTIVQAKQNIQKVISSEDINYELPYPGMLPDHPLYKLKMVRDKLWEFLISDLERKAYFEILMADKRVSASRVLIEERRNIDLGLSTFGKGFKYLEKTPSIVKALRERNININNIVDKLEVSTLKHASYLQNFLKQPDLSQKQKDEIKSLLRMYEEFYPKVTSLH